MTQKKQKTTAVKQNIKQVNVQPSASVKPVFGTDGLFF
jgi:hypothetical protein